MATGTEKGYTRREAPTKACTSKDLLRLEHNDAFPAIGAKWLSIKKEQSILPSSSKAVSSRALAGESSVLHRVQAFLPLLDEANCKLAEAIKEKGSDDYNIEVLNSREATAYVEMDLVLGVADLYSSDAVSAAERLASGQVIDIVSPINEADSEEEVCNPSSAGENDAINMPMKRKRQPKIEEIS